MLCYIRLYYVMPYYTMFYDLMPSHLLDCPLIFPFEVMGNCHCKDKDPVKEAFEPEPETVADDADFPEASEFRARIREATTRRC